MPDNRTYRIKANIQEEDHVDINLNMVQDISMFEFLSMKIGTENLYRLHTANYGVVAGRVLANGAVGVPNVKISIFIEADDDTKEDAVLSYLYPYSSVSDRNNDKIRYNLLPEDVLFQCHQAVGSFPSKRRVLDENNVLEIFDKYYKFTTTTNSAGDYMIFGVPVGTQILHMDVDLSDIGDLLSQKPRDFIYKGYNVNQFENANMFKKDTNLDTLVQIFSQTESVNVHPFWGEVDEMGEVDSTGVRITRKDISLNYKFEPTCVFLGSLVTDEKSNGITKRCIPTERMGKMDRLTTGEGTIEMIRKTPDGSVEEFSIMGNQLIDGNGTWCYQIPMNLDYVRTDEYGNIVPTNDTEKGLPTRAKVRFRISLNDFASDYQNNHLTKMLVPNNPQSLSEMGDAYIFGTNTPENEFRDLFWNKVYSVKSYIPRLQKGNANREKRFTGVKAVNVNVGNNPIPYNNMRIDITFMFVLQCAIMHTLIWIAGVVNSLITVLFDDPPGSCTADIAKRFKEQGSCVTVGDGACPDLDGWYFAPKCTNRKLKNDVYPLTTTLERLISKEFGDDDNPPSTDVNDKESIDYRNRGEKDDGGDSVCLTNRIDYFMQCIEIALAQEYDVIQFDFYNDWMNGMLYIPRWFANIKKKRKYLFGTIGPKESKVQACMEEHVKFQRRYVQQCALEYEEKDGRFANVSSPRGCVPANRKGKFVQKCHKGKGRKNVKILKYNKRLGRGTSPGGGYIHNEGTTRGDRVYYFRPCDWYYAAGTTSIPKKINYFATDIILLGSLSEHDMDGIPQAFKELTSSSYQMPTNLAATNMDTIAYMYGVASNGESICNNGMVSSLDVPSILTTQGGINFTTDVITIVFDVMREKNITLEDLYAQGEINLEAYNALSAMYQAYINGSTISLDSVGDGELGLTKLPSLFSIYYRWGSTQDFSDDLENDEDEYEITESSGIDWGYTGPGQKHMVSYRKGNKTITEEANFDNSFYQPGGHFLGIACSRAESNVKSCVNLSRICEMGATMSQRQAVMARSGNELVDDKNFLVPTGLISKDEISDTGFRMEFAMLNHNGLATKINPLTRRAEYDFLTVLPINFDGAMANELSGITAYSPYNNLSGVTFLWDENNNFTTTSSDGRDLKGDNEFTRTIESNSIDYYDFRFGIGNKDWNDNGRRIEEKYLIVETGENGKRYAYLPMYNNSYYFYFGLKDGSTALDRFYKEFFASCPDGEEEEVDENE